MSASPGSIEDRVSVPLVLCADDYGIAPGVSESVLALCENGRLSATSCMTVSRHWRDLAPALADVSSVVDVGLHLTLTDQEALSRLPDLAPGGRLPPLGKLMKSAFLGRLNYPEIRDEFERQFDAFEDATGRQPDFVDGHHHIHQLPTIRNAMLEIAANRLQGPKYVRICGDSLGRIAKRGISPVRSLVIGGIGAGLRRRCSALGLRTNSVFAGVYDFSGQVPYADLFAKFCDGQKPNGLIMCHPGFVDDELRRADSLTDQRTVEHQFFMSAEFLEILDSANLSISRFRV